MEITANLRDNNSSFALLLLSPPVILIIIIIIFTGGFNFQLVTVIVPAFYYRVP